MPIDLHCENGHRLRVKESAVGKRVRCPKCNSVVLVEAEPQSEKAPNVDDAVEISQARGPQKRTGRLPKSKAAKPSGNSVALYRLIGCGLVVIAAVACAVFSSTFFSSRGPETAPGSTSNVANGSTATNPARAPEVQTIAPKQSVPAVVESTLQTVGASTPDAAAESRTASTSTSSIKQSEPNSTPLSTPITAAPATVAITSKGLHIWDTGVPHLSVVKLQNLVTRGSDWMHLEPEQAGTHEFRGSCAIENEKLWLHIPQDSTVPITLAAKVESGEPPALPIIISGLTAGRRTIIVTEFSTTAVTINVGSEGASSSLAFRVSCGKYWIEAIPVDNVETLSLAVQAQFVVVPTEYGEDAICDAAAEANRKILPMPHENMVIALERGASFMSLLTYPSITQAGELTIDSGSGRNDATRGENMVVKTMSAKFKGHSVFVSLLPLKDVWFIEGVGKKYSASGQYSIKSQPPYPGVWRIVGRIDRKYYIIDAPSEHLMFACSHSGTLDCLFGYLMRPGDEVGADVPTPMTVYRETIGDANPDAYLLETDIVNLLEFRSTKYRDVCNSIDDMKDAWRNQPQMLAKDPAYVLNLLGDCRSIIDRMDERLHLYEDLTHQIGGVLEQISTKDFEKGDATAQAFRGALRKANGSLKAIKIVAANRADQMVADIEHKLQPAANGRYNASELDKLAERLRSVASRQEEQLKKLRGIVLQLSQAAMAIRETTDSALRPHVTTVGRQCRKILRTRDSEE